MRPFRVIEIYASNRVLKDGRRLPRRAHRASIASLFDETELKPENVQNVALIVRHDVPPRVSPAGLLYPGPLSFLACRRAVTALTGSSDVHHKLCRSRRARGREEPDPGVPEQVRGGTNVTRVVSSGRAAFACAPPVA